MPETGENCGYFFGGEVTTRAIGDWASVIFRRALERGEGSGDHESGVLKVGAGNWSYH